MTDKPPSVPGYTQASMRPDFLTGQPDVFSGAGGLGGNAAYPSPSLFFAKNASEAGSFTPQQARGIVVAGQQSLKTGTAKPCATCDKNQPYSVAFEVKDANGNLCNKGAGNKSKGMYYTVKYKLSGDIYAGATDENGLTERYFTANPAETIYLYLGHRNKSDGYPEDQSEAENAYDEAPLGNIAYAIAPIAEEKIEKVTTKRLWKPWAITKDGEDFTASREALRRNEYDSDGAATGNVTIGIGKLVHEKAFVMDQTKVDQTVQYLRDNGQPVTVDNIVSAVGPATGLKGKDLTNAMEEMKYVNGITDQDAIDLFKNKTYPEHRKNVEKVIHVPLYKNEYDALSDVAYNRGPGIIDKTGKKKNGQEWNPGGNYAEWLNRGRYHYTGDDRIRNLARTAVPNRRDDEADVFLNGNYAPQKMSIRDYQPQNRTPWEHVDLD